MQLLGLIKLDDFKRKHADTRGALDVWRALVEQAQWSGPQDVKNHYPSASFLADNRVIFNIKGTSHRRSYHKRSYNGIVLIEWVRNHAEYDKKNF